MINTIENTIKAAQLCLLQCFPLLLFNSQVDHTVIKPAIVLFSKEVNYLFFFITTQELNVSNSAQVNIFSNRGALHKTWGSQVLCHYL